MCVWHFIQKFIFLSKKKKKWKKWKYVSKIVQEKIKGKKQIWIHVNKDFQCSKLFRITITQYTGSLQNTSAKILQATRLMIHNWQNWKRVFLSSYCHGIYRVEALGLKKSSYIWKIMILLICEIWGSFLKIQYFANNFLIKVRIWEIFFTHVTHIIVIILHTANFVSTKLIFS